MNGLSFSGSAFSGSTFLGSAQTSVEHVLNALPAGILVALFAWALLRVLGRQNSGTRFAVWFLALLTVVALPFIGALSEGQTLIGSVVGSGIVAGMSPETAWGSMRPAITIPATWGLVAFCIWLLGATVAMARLAVGLWRLRVLRQSCSAIAPADLNAVDLDPVVRKTIDAISASGSVTVATSESVRVPAAIGFWKKTIILPGWALRELPANDLNVILLHEFAHLQRGDDWTNLVQKIVRALFFFHPAVWWIEKRLSVEREMACDDAVLAQTANPHGYATCLVSLLEKSLAHRLSRTRWSLAQAAVHRAHEAALRLAQILDKNRPVATRVWKPALGMLGVFSLICLVALSLSPQIVAVDRGLVTGNADHSYSAAVTEPLPQMAAVVPASLRTSEPSAVGTSAKVVRPPHVVGTEVVSGQRVNEHRVNEPQNEHQLVSDRIGVTESNPAPARDHVVAISAGVGKDVVPEFQTLVFIQTTIQTTIQATQYGTADSPVWRVQVWRVMVVSPMTERSARVPVAHST